MSQSRRASRHRGEGLIRFIPHGLRRIIAISISMVMTYASTSVLGLVFWGIAGRQLRSLAEFGVAGLAYTQMGLFALVGTLGLGTLLISRFPHTPQANRRVMVRTALFVSGLASGVLGLVVPVFAVHVLGMHSLDPLAGTASAALVFSAATALMGVSMVLDQAVLVLGNGALQLHRNIVASIVKIVALLVFTEAGWRSGMAVIAAWGLGNLVSFPLVAFATRGGRQLQAQDVGLVEMASLRGMRRAAAANHALNLTLQLPLQLLPVLVTVMLSQRANGVMTGALQVTGFVFALPYALSVGLFAAAEGDTRGVLQRMRLTLPMSMGISLLMLIILVPLAPFALRLFGVKGLTEEGVTLLRILVLAGIPFVIKDHYVALRRVQQKESSATVTLLLLSALELAGAAVGAATGGLLGLGWLWVAVLMFEAGALGHVLIQARRQAMEEIVHNDAEDHTMAAQVTGGSTTRAASSGEGSVLEQHEKRPSEIGRRVAPPAFKAGARLPDAPSRLTRFGAGPLVLVSSLGLLVNAAGVTLGEAGRSYGLAQLLFVLGLALIFLPSAVAALAPGLSGRHRAAAVVWMMFALQLSRVVLYPDKFMFHDELIHATVLRHIVDSGQLHTANSLLPVTPFYPGLEVASAAVESLTGLSAHTSAVIVMLTGRMVLALALFHVIWWLTRSDRVAAAGVIVYSCNPQVLFFNSQFSYQTLSLPLAMFTLALFVGRRRRFGMLGMVAPGVAVTAVVQTHHVTSVLLILTWLVWAILDRWASRRRQVPAETGPLLMMAGVTAGALLLTLFVPGNPLVGYLDDIVMSSTTDLSLLAGGTATKGVFVNSAGVVSTPIERLLMVFSVAVTFGVLVWSWLRARWWTQHRRTFGVFLLLVAMLYVGIPGGHVARATAEVGDRASGFVYLAVGFVIAWSVWQLSVTIRRAVVMAIITTLVFLGGIMIGDGPVARQLPGPFRISADARSVDADNLQAAYWAGANLPDNSPLYADRVSGLLMAALGQQRTIRHVSTKVDASRLLLDPELTSKDRALIRRLKLDYLVADTRDANGLPNVGVYIESGEFGSQNRRRPVSRQALSKFDAAPGADRIYDNGAIVIYDVRNADAN